MTEKKFIQVFEYQSLRYTDSNIFKKHHFDALVKYNEQHQNKYFTIIHQGIRFGNYVGVMQIGGLTLEILPKVDNREPNNKLLWQHILLNMLKACKHLPIDSISETNLKIKNHSILDAYFELFLSEVERLLKIGLIKKYRRTQANLNTLKGKLLIKQNLQRNIVHKEKLYCEHQVYDKNHLLHQILLKALQILKNLEHHTLKDKINRLLLEFQDFDTVSINKKQFESIIFDRKNQDYKKAIEIAKIIILNYSPSLNAGNENMLTLLFDMNALWEEYIFRILNKHKPENTTITFQNAKLFWENKRIRPDIVISTKNEHFVIDTKWKITDNNNPADDDLKQMFVYNLHWNASKTMLLYPKTNQEDSKFGSFHYNNPNFNCKLGFIDLKTNDSIKPSKIIAHEIFEKIYQTSPN